MEKIGVKEEYKVDLEQEKVNIVTEKLQKK